ncbi:unnamed protein product, partial [Sphacelaria rigidula]
TSCPKPPSSLLQEFLVRSAKMIGAHYPERSYKIFILNAPWWFSLVWKV